MSEQTLPTDIEATSFLSWPIIGLARLLSESTTFRARGGAASAGNAYALIHYPYLQPTLDLDVIGRPAAIIMPGDTLGLERVDASHLRPEPDLLLVLTDWDRFPERADYSAIDFLNFAGNTLTEIAALQGQDDRLAIKGIAWKEKPGLTDPNIAKEQAGYWICSFRVQVSRL